VETNNPPVTTPPPSPSRTPSGGNEEGEGATTNGERETPQVEHNSLPVSTQLSPVATTSSPAGASPPPQRRQRTRQPPAYLKDFVRDRVTSGRQESLTGCRTEKLAARRGSYEHHSNINFGEGGVVGRITTPGHTVPASRNKHAVQSFRTLMQSGEDILNLPTSKFRTLSMIQNIEF